MAVVVSKAWDSDDEWKIRAACRGMPIDIWYAEGKTADHSTALAVCATCPVKTECLESALVEETVLGHQATLGIRGGKTDAQRKKIRKRRKMMTEIAQGQLHVR